VAKTLRKTLKLAKRVRGKSPSQCRGPQDLSQLELECMKTIWLQGASTVAEVQQCLSPSRPLAYTTVLTILDRLAKKGAVTRSKRGKAHLYEPVLSFEDSRKAAVNQVLDFYFQGSLEQLIEHLDHGAGAPASRISRREISVANSVQMHESLL